MSTEFRPIAKSDETDAVALWTDVMSASADYFARYFTVDPWYQEGDCLGAWMDGKLASAVHICRRPVVWSQEALLAGGIANVATYPDYRRRGLSRELLQRAIAHMERIGVHFSGLGTGIPSHYAPLGWQVVDTPAATVNLGPDIGNAATALPDWAGSKVTPLIESLYAAAPRPLQMLRSTRYFTGWTGWVWAKHQATLWTLPGAGYIAIHQPADIAEPIQVLEMRTLEADSEAKLLSSLCAWAQESGRLSVSLNSLPQWQSSLPDGPDAVSISHRRGKMLRNIRLSPETYTAILTACKSGQAAWWAGDGF